MVNLIAHSGLGITTSLLWRIALLIEGRPLCDKKNLYLLGYGLAKQSLYWSTYHLLLPKTNLKCAWISHSWPQLPSLVTGANFAEQSQCAHRSVRELCIVCHSRHRSSLWRFQPIILASDTIESISYLDNAVAELDNTMKSYYNNISNSADEFTSSKVTKSNLSFITVIRS
jgi:hypothetical protein